MSTAGHGSRAALSTFISLVLAAALLPASAVAQPLSGTAWSDDIPALLSAGDFEEGVVVACVSKADAERFSVRSLASDLAGSAQASDGEKVIDVSAESVADSLADASTPLAAADAADSYELVTVSDPQKTTEQIMCELADDPAVLFAEPNYVFDRTDADEEEDLQELAAVVQEEAQVQAQADGSPFSDVVASGDVNPSSQLAMGDLTDLQYAYNQNSTLQTKPGVNASTNDSAWNTAGGNMDRPVVVALLDSGADYNNPDLQSQMYTFTPEQQEVLNCGKYGYNAALGEDSRDVSGFHVHGTHCAGIIGAQWNDEGVSGAGSNISIVNIRISGKDGRTSVTNIVAAFDFLKRAVAAGVPVEITSNSYGHMQSSRIVNAVVYDAGSACNITSVFGAGNDSLNLNDSNYTTNTLADNPYAVIVGASNPSDNMASYSSYGLSVVDLGAPGTGILSAFPVGESTYIADADTDNLHYQGFEQEGAGLFTQVVIDGDGGFASKGSSSILARDVHLSGSGSAKIELDAPWAQVSDLGLYMLQSQPVQVAKPANGETAYVGLSAFSDTDAALISFPLAKSSFSSKLAFAVKNTEGTWTPVTYSGAMRRVGGGGCWENMSIALPSNTDYDNFQVIIGFAVDGAAAGNVSLCIDSFAVGTQIAPFSYDTGTSMACPCVAGSMAVEASRYAMTDPQNNAAQRAATMIASVRSNPDFAGKVSSGGVLDMSVSADATEPQKALAPVVSNITVNGSTLTVTGQNFGIQSGSANLVVAQSGLASVGSALDSRITSWAADSISVTLASRPSGILNVTVSNASGKRFATNAFAGLSDAVYENRLSTPDLSPEKDAVSYEEFAASETAGLMIGLQGKLYYLPDQTKIEGCPSTQRMWTYDIATDSWKVAPELPEPLEGTSIALWKGCLVVEGGSMDTVEGAPISSENSIEKVYAFNPETQTWTQASAQGVSVGATLSTLQGNLVMVGGKRPDAATLDLPEIPVDHPSRQVLTYSIEEGAGSSVATTNHMFTNASVESAGDSLYVARWGIADLSPLMERIESGKAEDLDGYPSFLAASTTERSFASLADGIAMVGPVSADGAADTYTMNSSQTSFVPSGKRLSDADPLDTASCAYNGQLYAMAATVAELTPRVFRSTAVNTVQDPNDVALSGGETPSDGKPSDDNAGSEKELTSSKLVATGDALVVAPVLVLLVGAAVVCCHARRRTGIER